MHANFKRHGIKLRKRDGNGIKQDKKMTNQLIQSLAATQLFSFLFNEIVSRAYSRII